MSHLNRDAQEEDPFTDDAVDPITEEEQQIRQLRSTCDHLTRELQRERALKQQTLAAVSKSLNNLQDMLTLIQIGGLKDGD